MAYLRHLRGMPWVVMVDFSSDTILSTVWAFERRVALVAMVILVLGFLTAWLLSRGITGPLEQLTTAAETVATGRDIVPVSATRHAELARLADAFNGMAARVQESQHVLEDRVAARTHELQERNEELEAFGYSISHDLRAPLRAMQGFSQILLDEYGERLDDEGRRYAGRIVAGATRMDQLIRDLLAYSRISREQLQPVAVNLSRIVKAALEQIDAELTERGADVKVQEPLPAVVGHAATLSQVVANLLGNGAKFMPPGRVPRLNVRAEPRRQVVRLWVEDNGIGIQPEHQERIFGVFERLHGNDEYPGTGIGLAIVRKGIERMGGRVGVESTPGQGSRFWIELPPVSAA
jgi:signal transduction histidine kinase